MKSYRNIALAALAVSTVSVAVLSACGSSSSPGNAAGGDDDDDASIMGGGGGGSGTDGSMSGSDRVVPPPADGSMSSMDAMMDAPMATAPEPDAGPINCDEMIDPSQVFVSTGTGSQAGGSCLPSSPCTTIAAAFSAAGMSHATTVYIDEGTYIEQVNIPPSIQQIRGGWIRTGSNWAVDCNNDTRFTSTVIQAPGSVNKTVIAVGGTTLLQSLYIKSKGSAQPSESLYGIFATGGATSLSLVDIAVVTAPGGDGANGGAGTMGTAGGVAGSCPVGANPPASPTPPTGVTQGGARVTYGAAGATVSPGGTGTMGGAGGNGVMVQGACDNDCVTCDGSEGNCVDDGPQTLCGGAGPNGCGGGAASVGGGGGGGGVSITLYAWDAMVTITRGLFQAERGGNGGTGGAYASGGAPSSGTQGSPSAYCGTVCSGMGCRPEEGKQIPGGTGTAGATGAVSVGGAGGAGGDSFAYYGNNNNVTVLELPDAVPGAAGTGGMGGAQTGGNAPSGMNGVEAMTNE